MAQLTPDSKQQEAFILQQLSLSLEHLAVEEQTQVEEYLRRYADIFALDSSELGTTTIANHQINTGGHPPVWQPARWMPFALREQVDKMVQEMLTQKEIVSSSSLWAGPVMLVRKKNGGMWFCIDYYCKMNNITKLDEFPLPRIDDTLDLPAGAKYFTTLDLASHGVFISREDCLYHPLWPRYECTKMPFGLKNAPAMFQRLMEAVLTGLARGVCHVYLDDVLVFGKTLKEHNHHLELVLERIRAAGLCLKPQKCNIARLSVEYLGYIVSAAGIETDPKKVKAVAHYLIPTDLKSHGPSSDSPLTIDVLCLDFRRLPILCML